MATDRTFFALATRSTTTKTEASGNVTGQPYETDTEVLSSVIDLGDERALSLVFARDAVSSAVHLARPPRLYLSLECADDPNGILGSPGDWRTFFEFSSKDLWDAGPGKPVVDGAVAPMRYVRARAKLSSSQSNAKGDIRFSLTARST